MQPPNKLPLVKAALKMLVEQLGENDRVAIVVYAGSVGPGAAADAAATSKADDPRGASTSCRPAARPTAAQGIQLAYEQRDANFIKGGINRVILCTDGDFNVGVTERGRPRAARSRRRRKSGVFLTVLGFGMGNLKDATMEKLADKGNGNYAYIDTLQRGPQGARRADERHAGHDRQGREDPGRVQPGAGRARIG